MKVTLSREESPSVGRYFTKISSRVSTTKIVIEEDIEGEAIGRNMKSTEKELTYHKSNKREFDPSDMLKGKRRKRQSGIGVLVGLDVSGSMRKEWHETFVDLSKLIEDLRNSLDIENVTYFTYDSRLREVSNDLSKLKIGAFGGNAFGYVYQQLMKKAPVLLHNEIILITDCGDNLGFPLNNSCEVVRKRQKVQNHISVIDTEGAGFYDKSGFDENDWSLHHMGDRTLFTDIQDNLQKLIERIQ